MLSAEIKAHQTRHDEHDPAEITGPVAITRLQGRELIQCSPQRFQYSFFGNLFIPLKLDAWQVPLMAVLLGTLQRIHDRDSVKLCARIFCRTCLLRILKIKLHIML